MSCLLRPKTCFANERAGLFYRGQPAFYHGKTALEMKGWTPLKQYECPAVTCFTLISPYIMIGDHLNLESRLLNTYLERSCEIVAVWLVGNMPECIRCAVLCDMGHLHVSSLVCVIRDIQAKRNWHKWNLLTTRFLNSRDSPQFEQIAIFSQNLFVWI